MKAGIRLACAVSFVIVGLAPACSDGVGPEAAAGTYVLHDINGTAVPLEGVNVPVGGMIRHTADGRAERRVRYRTDFSGTTEEFAAFGTFAIRGDSVALALSENGAQPSWVWQPSAVLRAGVLTLQYPSPVDGPDIVEAYVRVL